MYNAYQTQQDDDKHSVVSTHSFKQYGLTINVKQRPSISKSIKNEFEPKHIQNKQKIPNKSNPYHLKQNKDEYLFDKPMNIVQNIYTKNSKKQDFYPNQSHIPQNDYHETQSVQHERSDRKDIRKKFKQDFQISNLENDTNIPRVKSQVKSFQPQHFTSQQQMPIEKQQQRSFKKKVTEIEEDKNLEKEISFEGGRYVGQIFDEDLNGRGILYDNQNRVQYEGGFKEGNFDGYGKLYNYTNEYLNLDCSEDLGMAELSWTLYEGTFENNKKQGIGYLHFSNKDIFCGEFKMDKANGFGIYSSQNTKVCGIWKNNILVERIN